MSTKLQPGIELDHLIAEKVMGLIKPRDDEGMWRTSKGSLIGFLDSFTPSTDIGIAWEVVEKIKDNDTLGLDLRWHKKDSMWICGTVSPGDHGEREMYFPCESVSAPHAICLAALKAKGVKIE